MIPLPSRSLGSTALAVWRNWRALPWQGQPCFAQAPALGEYCWQPDRRTPSGFALHRVLCPLTTRPASAAEEDAVWDALMQGHLQIYLRRNQRNAVAPPSVLLHEATGVPLASGVDG